jgi:hypothetical protein
MSPVEVDTDINFELKLTVRKCLPGERFTETGQ